DDLGRLVVDDRAPLPIPEDRYRHHARVGRPRSRIGLVEVAKAVQRVGLTARVLAEAPALPPVVGDRHGHGDDALQTLELAEHHRPPRPWAVVGDVKVVTARHYLKARRTVRRHPVPERALLPYESPGIAGDSPSSRVPFAVDEKSHRDPSLDG